MGEQLIRIYGAEFEPTESKTFSYRPSKNDRRATGMLFSHNSALSLSFQNNMDLQVNQVEFAYQDESLPLPPSKRVIELDQDLNDCKVITGTIENLRTQHQNGEKRTINIYLLVEQE